MCSVAATDGYRKSQSSGQDTVGSSGVDTGTRSKKLGKRKGKGAASC